MLHVEMDQLLTPIPQAQTVDTMCSISYCCPVVFLSKWFRELDEDVRLPLPDSNRRRGDGAQSAHERCLRRTDLAAGLYVRARGVASDDNHQSTLGPAGL